MNGYGMALHDHHAAMLAASAIPADIAHERGYVTISEKAMLRRHGFGNKKAADLHVPGLLVPLWDVWGERAGCQYRPDIANGKRKYETPYGQANVIDCPPRVRPHLGDLARPLLVTEGSKKADAAVAAGLDCVSLSGVWNWKGRDPRTEGVAGSTTLSDWDAIALKGRDVLLAFDSDIIRKPAVRQACERLAEFLTRRGAHVAYVMFPMLDGGAKCGLDDYIAAGHTAADVLGCTTDRLPVTLVTDATDAEPRREPEGWGVVGALLDHTEQILTQYVAFPEPHHAVAAALWVAHAHNLDAAESTPRLAGLSPEPGSGKTRLLEVLELLTPNALHTVNLSTAAMFRIIEKERPTLLLDEADTYLGTRISKEHEDLRGLVNAGHRRGAVTYRCVGDGANLDVKAFPAYAAVAIAGLGDLPETIMARSIVLPMRRRRPDEHVAPFRRGEAEPELAGLRERLAAWADTNGEQLAAINPTMPPGVTDRPADVWEPLLAIAEAAGGDWPKRARAACAAIVAATAERAVSLGVRLLLDIRRIYDQAGTDRIATADLLDKLHDLDDAPWSELRGKPITDRSVARLLKAYDIGPRLLRVDGVTLRGYERGDFLDAWARYCPDVTDTDPAGGGGTFSNASTCSENTTPHPDTTTTPDVSVTSVTAVTAAEFTWPDPGLRHPTHACGECGRHVEPAPAAVTHGWRTICRACSAARERTQ